MATLEIEGKDVEVDDAFLSLSPEDQEKTVAQIAKSIGVGPSAKQKNPGEGLAYGEMPEGMVLDPHTGRVVDTKAIAEERGGSLAGAALKGFPFIGSWADELVGMGDPVRTELARHGAMIH